MDSTMIEESVAIEARNKEKKPCFFSFLTKYFENDDMIRQV